MIECCGLDFFIIVLLVHMAFRVPVGICSVSFSSCVKFSINGSRLMIYDGVLLYFLQFFFVGLCYEVLFPVVQ